jgi:two-component system, LytTR family, sensor histidine kinase AgrC
MLTFILTIFENIVFVLILSAAFSSSKRIPIRNVFFFIWIYSVFTTSTYFFVTDLNIRMLANILVHFFCMKIFFSFSLRNAVLTTLVRSAFQMVLELVTFLIIALLRQYFEFESSGIAIAFFIYSLMAFIALIIHKKRFKINIVYNNEIHLKQFSPILIIALLQIVTACLIYFEKTKVHVMPIFTIIFMVSIILFILRLLKIHQEATMKKSEQLHLNNLEQLLHSIRGQRHDHMNHLQVISNLLSTESYKEASSYLTDLKTDINMDYSLLTLNHPSLIALLQTKREYAIISEVELQIITKVSISNIPLKSYELIQVVGNIIDNAFDEEIESKKELKKIIVTIDSLYNSLIVFSINNLNSVIDTSEKSFFYEGFSMKENHKGLGLYTVMNILNKYNSFIEFQSDPETGTTFFVFIPY